MVKKKKITMDDLAVMMRAGFAKTAKKSEMRKEIANLAAMTQRGFSELTKNMNDRFDKVEQLEKGPIANHEKRIKRVEELLLIK